MRKKINEYLIGVAVLSIGLTLFLTICFFWRVELNQTMNTLGQMTRQIAAVEGAKEPDRLREFVETWEAGEKSVPESEKLRVTLISADGTVLYDNMAKPTEMENHSQRPEVQAAMQNEDGSGEGTRYSSTIGVSTCYYALRLSDGSVLRTALTTTGIWDALEDMLPLGIVVIALLLMLASVLALTLTKRVLAPIQEMAKDPLRKNVPEIYPELQPLLETITNQHKEVLAAANMRQEFTANISHELKTPLTAISGYAELIESGIATEKDTLRFGQEIHHNADRLLKLINDIIRLSELDMGAAEEDKEELVDLRELAVNCVGNLELNARNYDVQIILLPAEEADKQVLLKAYKQQMEELLYNLCDNAIRYNVRGGNVKVSVETCREKEKTMARLVVKDTGIGIPPEHQGRIFERFYRVDKSRSKQTGGTGLGLAIVKHIVAQSGGSIRLKSEVGRGTEITVLLPVKK